MRSPLLCGVSGAHQRFAAENNWLNTLHNDTGRPASLNTAISLSGALNLPCLSVGGISHDEGIHLLGRIGSGVDSPRFECSPAPATAITFQMSPVACRMRMARVWRYPGPE